jgi:hypothetical protein
MKIGNGAGLRFVGLGEVDEMLVDFFHGLVDL